jgi:nitrate reductase gamma subunit
VHAVMAFVLVAIFPFSRLVHVISVPLTYLGRPYQVLIRYRQRRGSEG